MSIEEVLGLPNPKKPIRKVEVVFNVVDGDGNPSSEAFQMDPANVHFCQHRPVFHGQDGMLLGGQGYLVIHGATKLVRD